MGSSTGEKPHVVLIPFPAQGHVTVMLQLAKLFHSRDFHITFVNTEFNHSRLVRTRGPDSVRGLPDFRFETIPDGLPPSDGDATQHVPALCDSTMKNCLAPFSSLLQRLNGQPSPGAPKVTCIVADIMMTFTLDAAAVLGVPCALFSTISAAGLLACLHFQHLISKGLAPLKDPSEFTNGYLDTIVEPIPGLQQNMRLKDFPSFIRTTDPAETMLNFTIHEVQRAPKASAIILNTFDIERSTIEAMASLLPPLYPIGPLPLLTRQLPPNHLLSSVSSSLWKEDTTCLEWLQGREPNSVVYVNFGSIIVMSNDQLVELAWGLANSEQDFLWVIRPDLVKGETSVLPMEFLGATKGRGLVASWCPQEAVLSHPAVGGFLTHCGWNSMLESISGGVPMICCPFFAEQPTNSRCACAEWGTGMEMDGDVKREKVEGLVRELMRGEKGNEMRKRALKWKEGAIKAAGPGGASSVNLERLINEVLLLPKEKI